MSRQGGEDLAEVHQLVEPVREGLLRLAALAAAGEVPAENWRLVQQAVVEVLAGESGRLAGLSDREREVWGLRCEGYTSREIGERLALSEHTVNTHVQNVHAKLEVWNIWEVALWRGQREG